MGLKGISWIEQHVEKVVVGVFGVSLLAIVAMQFVGRNNKIDLPEKKGVPIDEAWGVVEGKAEEVLARITSVSPDAELSELPQGPGVFEGFTARQRGPVAPQQRLATALDRPAFAPAVGAIPGVQRVKAETYAAVSVPAPATPVAATYMATVHPQEVMLNPELLGIYAPGLTPSVLTDNKLAQHFSKLDRAAVSVETRFDGTALEAALLADPDGAGPASPMPRHWWDGRMVVLGVEMERQELKADGTWGDASPVIHMPGRIDVLAAVKEMESGVDFKFGDILTDAGRASEEILRPAYYSVIFGEDWVPPSEAIEDLAAIGVGGDAVTKAKKQLSDIDRELSDLDQDIKRLEQDAGAPGGPSARPPVRQPGKSGTPPREERRPDATGPRDPKQMRLDGLRARYERLYKRRTAIVEELRRLGEDPDAGQPGSVIAPPKPTAAAKPLLLDDAVRVWAHDIAVARGKTYRYRMALVLNNPVYGNTSALSGEQAELGKSPTMRTAMSGWSEPVRVDPETYYFVTSASPKDDLSKSARAAAEVFVFSAGYWRKGAVALEPGDTIAAEVRVPDPEKILAMLPMQPGEAPGIRPMEPAPAGPRGRPGIPPGRGETPIPMPPRPDQGTGEPPTMDPSMMMIPKAVAEDAMLLDVASTAVVTEEGASKLENQAFLVNEQGEIVIRTPEGDRTMVSYLRLLRSSERGEDALRPRTAAPAAPVAPIGVPGQPKQPDGGGGGGGGG